jgi:methylmalonyl-CoA mutase C-terminal domain/subunit
MTPERVLVAILGLDQHETGALAVSSMLRDAGMEVIYLGRFASPQTIAATALDESVDVVGVSCHSWEYVYYVDDLLRLLRERDHGIPLVLGGSVITPADGRRLREKGVAAVFGPSASADEIVRAVRDLAAQRRLAH